MRKKIVLLLVVSLLFSGVLAGCRKKAEVLPEDGFPAIKVVSGKNNIEWVVGMNRLGNTECDREDNLLLLMKDRVPENLVHLENGEDITVEFDGAVPDAIKLTEHIIRPDGSPKYTTEHEGTVIDAALKKGKATFTIEKNYVTALSSYSGDYAPGATLKGYRLLCNWGSDQCEYTFVIRGDAAITMLPEESE